MTAFSGRGEALRVLGKGSRALVKGHLRTKTFEKDGVRVECSEVIADFVEFQDIRELGRAECCEDAGRGSALSRAPGLPAGPGTFPLR